MELDSRRFIRIDHCIPRGRPPSRGAHLIVYFSPLIFTCTVWQIGEDLRRRGPYRRAVQGVQGAGQVPLDSLRLVNECQGNTAATPLRRAGINLGTIYIGDREGNSLTMKFTILESLYDTTWWPNTCISVYIQHYTVTNDTWIESCMNERGQKYYLREQGKRRGGDWLVDVARGFSV